MTSNVNTSLTHFFYFIYTAVYLGRGGWTGRLLQVPQLGGQQKWVKQLILTSSLHRILSPMDWPISLPWLVWYENLWLFISAFELGLNDWTNLMWNLPNETCGRHIRTQHLMIIDYFDDLHPSTFSTVILYLAFSVFIAFSCHNWILVSSFPS